MIKPLHTYDYRRLLAHTKTRFGVHLLRVLVQQSVMPRGIEHCYCGHEVIDPLIGAEICDAETTVDGLNLRLLFLRVGLFGSTMTEVNDV